MSYFKIAVTTIFGICILIGLALFAMSKGSDSEQQANLLVWGTISSDAFNTALVSSSLFNSKLIKAVYVKKDVANFDADFVEALASGVGPDIIIIRDDFLYKHHNKLFVIPYKNYGEGDFKNRFIEEGEVFLSPEGVVAIPFIVDPLVMYWNRDIFSNNSIAETPKYWEDLLPLIEKTTRRDASANILQSTIAFGEWGNITNAKEIIAMLLMQAGTPITDRDKNKGNIVSVLNDQFGQPVIPSQAATLFYTEFSNPTSPKYTWNRSLPSSANFFLQGNLAMYIGFASELFSIQQKNSNLNFNVTFVPQAKDTKKKSVFAHMYALAIVKQSKQIAGSYVLINALTEAPALKALEGVTNLPPVRRDLLSQKPDTAFRSVFYDSALISRTWIDPNSTQSSATFRNLIESITSGRVRLVDALKRADGELNSQLK